MLRNLLLLTFGTVVLMLVLAYYTTDSTQRDAPPAAVVADLFDRVAFSGFGEQGPGGQGPYLRRWTQPVRIAVIGEPKEEEGEVAASRSWSDGVELMAELYDGLPNLDISVVESVPFALEGEDADKVTEARRAANMVIWTIPEDALATVSEALDLSPEEAGEVASYRDGCAIVGAKSAVLSMVSIVMRAELSPGKRRQCLGESMAMGLGFNIEDKNSSDVFRVRDNRITFHPLGRMATALVYDEAMQPGMPRAQALDKAMEILKTKGLQ